VSCESQKGELHPSNVCRVTSAGIVQDHSRWQVEDKETQPDHANGKVPEVTSGMEARAAMISTGLGVDDLDEAFQSRGWRALEMTRKSVESDSGTKRSLP